MRHEEMELVVGSRRRESAVKAQAPVRAAKVTKTAAEAAAQLLLLLLLLLLL